MKNKSGSAKKARLDIRLSADQKFYIERAARVGGFRNLTDFVVNALQEKAKQVIAEKEQVLASQEDKKTFFEEVTKPQAPNRALVGAVQEFENLFEE